eukprot:4690291-Pyramimonas_sp.AAC.1
MARRRGHLLHVTPSEAIKESTLGEGIIKFPMKVRGLCKAPGYGLLRLMPTRSEFPTEYAEHVPRWLSQRKDGEAPPARVYQAEGNAPCR